MKHLLIAICLLPMTVYAQTGGKYQIKKQVLPAALVLVAGALDGLNQVIAYQYPNFKARFPGANDRYWSTEISFLNKYKNGDPAQGAKFPGSKGVFVFLTDGYHLTRFGERLFLGGAFALKITQDKKRWWVYVVEGLGFWLVNRAGFCLIYNQFK